MRRRKPPEADEFDGTPARLARFRVSDWPADDDLEAAGMFWTARAAWEAEHGRPAALDHDTAPDGPFDPRTV